LKHESHARSGSYFFGVEADEDDEWLGRNRNRFVEHASQHKTPHERQWWRRFDIENLSKHSRHTFDAESAVQF
jgi:hypothetical protein